LIAVGIRIRHQGKEADAMMGDPQDRDEKLFYVGLSIDERVPADHVLRQIDEAVDFSLVRRRVEHLYGYNGHVSLDPALVLRLMLLLFIDNVRSERELMRQLPMRLDWLWFCRLGLDSNIPHHSVLSKARRRWGPKLFEELFTEVLKRCIDAGLVDGETVHADSTLLRASADRDRRVSRKLWEQLEGVAAGEEDEGDRPSDDDPSIPGEPTSPTRSARAKRNLLQVSPTDPDAAVHSRQGVGTILGYRDHRLVDDAAGVIVATHITPADGDDGAQLPILLSHMERRVGCLPREVTGDSQYGTKQNYDHCQAEGIRPYLKKRRGKSTPRVPSIELLPACCSRSRARHLSARRRTVAEGSFAEAHTRLDHRRCRWRRQWRVQIQAFLVATVQNLKKLAKHRGRRPAAMAAAAAATAAIVTLAVFPTAVWRHLRDVRGLRGHLHHCFAWISIVAQRLDRSSLLQATGV
jgi:transposase